MFFCPIASFYSFLKPVNLEMPCNFNNGTCCFMQLRKSKKGKFFLQNIHPFFPLFLELVGSNMVQILTTVAWTFTGYLCLVLELVGFNMVQILTTVTWTFTGYLCLVLLVRTEMSSMLWWYGYDSMLRAAFQEFSHYV